MMKSIKIFSIIGALAAVSTSLAHADERLFTYSYEADVLPEGGVEFEQWVTARAGREGGDYGRWQLRSEVEYGLTESLTGALYLNFNDVYFSPDDETQETEENFEFDGVSTELKYQLVNPHTNPIGVLLYGEGTFDSDFVEAEERLVFSSYLTKEWVAAFNVKLEQEWEFEHGETEKEGELDLSAGISYRFHENWATGLELRNVREYEGFEFEDEEARAWYAGPNIHYGAASWWATLTVMPQIPIEGDRDLEHQERVNVRLIVGKVF